MLQRMMKATAWIPGKLEDPSVVLRHLGGFNPSLRTACWRVVRYERPQEEGTAEGLRHLLVVQIPESQARALAALNDRPYHYFGQVNFKVAGRGQEEPVEAGRDQEQT